MRNKFTSIIMFLIIILIICVVIFFGNILWKEWQSIQQIAELEGVRTIITSDEATINEDIKTPQIIENPFDEIKDENSANQQIDYSNVKIEKYFYNQLDDYSKTIYKAFESNKENMKTGTYKVELGNSFSELLGTENGQDELGKYYQSAIEAYTYDNPDVFYLSPNKMYLNIETTTRGRKTTYYVYVNSGNQENYLIDEFSSQEQINQAIKKIEQVKKYIIQKKTGNTYDDIKMVHDYLIANIEYDSTISKDNIYNICGALINGEAVCEGYARAFKYLMDGLEIPCTLVIGTGRNSEGNTENHAWNYVLLNDNWYAIDTTWDDPVVTGVGWVSQATRYKYFLKGANDMNIDHQPNGRFTENGKLFKYPEISSDNFWDSLHLSHFYVEICNI